eukprot:TRINITY_DN2297_c0_g2_i3.p1 TRINITY_DN2297_c0_g2~~TRINITY_DN2297_c0_g2_i3.p1  ORF type:complete len:328 (-),score=38.77 TRINITY_DN2297_c0_g2_i3:57-1040(-)
MESRVKTTPSKGLKLHSRRSSGISVGGLESNAMVSGISARSWVVYDADKKSIVCGKSETEKREIASLTKIMTAYTVIKIVMQLDLNMMTMKVNVCFESAIMYGTSAKLEEGDTLTVWDLLHALLLPSGNDAAICLAEYFGFILVGLKIQPSLKLTNMVDVFVAEMNANAKTLKLANTTYANPHGLKDPSNKSTAEDVARLSAVCMNVPLFAEIVKKSSYSCTARKIDGTYKTYTWANTNKLITKEFNGVKTGITASAGPCLASSYKDDKRHLIIIVLSCKSAGHRWHEVANLKTHALDLLSSQKTPQAQKKLTLLPRKAVSRSSIKT